MPGRRVPAADLSSPPTPPMLHHKGYAGRVARDEQDGLFRGEVLGTHGLITFEGGSADEAEAAFCAAVDDYLAFCADRGEVPDLPHDSEPATDTVVLHLPRSVHHTLAADAQREGKTLDELVAELAVASHQPSAAAQGPRPVVERRFRQGRRGNATQNP